MLKNPKIPKIPLDKCPICAIILKLSTSTTEFGGIAQLGEQVTSKTPLNRARKSQKCEIREKFGKRFVLRIATTNPALKSSGFNAKMLTRGYSSAGRALEWHSRGQRFDPAYLHHRVLKTIGFQDFFFVKMVVLPLKCHFFKLGRYTRFPRYTLS